MITLKVNETLLRESYAYCEHITRTQARNFYYGLKLLPEPKRSAMYALYAYMRLVDDIADDEGHTTAARSAALEQWQAKTHAAMGAANEATLPSGEKMWPAFGHMAQTYRVPVKLFDDMIAGQRQDLTPTLFETFEQLKDYCYRVASVVGLASLYVWGFEDTPEVHQMAIDRGIAFQLTNILRDVREDAARGRCYYPAEHLRQFELSAADLAHANGHPHLKEFIRYQVAAAEGFYVSSQPLEEHVERDARPTLWAMTAIYRGILHKIRDVGERNPQRVLNSRISLSPVAKMLIAWKAMRRR